MDVEGKRVYIFGPMSVVGPAGNWNFPAFERAALLIEANGGIAVCPARIDDAVWGFDGTGEMRPGMEYKTVLAIDLMIIPTCDMGYGLRGWSGSNGAMPEVAYMQCLKMPIVWETGAEQGRVGYVADTLLGVLAAATELADLERRSRGMIWDWDNDADAIVAVSKAVEAHRDATASRDPLEETREIPRHPDTGHDYEEE